MKLGINLPNFGPQIDRSGIVTWAQTAEQSGFDLVLLSDHVVLTEDAARRSPPPFYECLSTLAWLAGHTTKIRLGAGVLIGTHRDPLHLAHETATIDTLSDGRLVVGMGVGWTSRAFDVLGKPFHRRGAETDTVLAVLKDYWANPTTMARGSHGAHLVHTGPGPIQRPGPPLWIGGNGTPAIRRSNEFGDAWHPLHPSRTVCEQGTSLLAEGVGFAPRIFFLPTRDPIGDNRPLGCGSIEEILADIRFLADLGAETVVLDTDPGDQSLRSNSIERDLELIGIAVEVVKEAAAPT